MIAAVDMDHSKDCTMNSTEVQAIVTISLLAAFADGAKHDRERDEIRRIAEGLCGPEGLHLPTLYQDVLLKRATLASTLPALASPESRQLAYEMAVCVCDADGARSPAEASFLRALRTGLTLDEAPADAFAQQVDVLTAAPLAHAATPAAAAAGAPATGVDDKALDADILKAAITNGALELLPETLSTLAIIPLQMKLVYRIGQAYGFQLDSGHVKDFIATAGVGLTSQYLEQAGRKLLGGLLGRLGGALAGGLGRQAVSSGMSFASTYALGQVARRYYAGGRVLTTQMLKDTYSSVLQDAQSMYAQYLPEMRRQAGTLDASRVVNLVRGG